MPSRLAEGTDKTNTVTPPNGQTEWNDCDTHRERQRRDLATATSWTTHC